MPGVKLAGEVASLETVPEAYRSNYESAGEGKFRLKEIEFEEPTALLNTVKATRDERDALKEKYKGVNLDEWNEYQSNKDKLASDAAKAKGDWEANEKRLKDQHAAQLKIKDDQIHSAVAVRDVQAALVAAGATEMGLELLTERLERSVKMVEGQTRVVDAAGKVRNNASGEPMTVTELAAEYKADTKFAGAFAASGAGGSGSPAGGAGSGRAGAGNKSMKRADFDNLDPSAQKAFVLKEKGVVVD